MKIQTERDGEKLTVKGRIIITLSNGDEYRIAENNDELEVNKQYSEDGETAISIRPSMSNLIYIS